MIIKKYLPGILVLALLLISFPYLRSVFADWKTDLDPPETTITATGTGCSTIGTVTTCPNTTTVNINISCSDPISDCQSIHASKTDSTPPYLPDFSLTVPPHNYSPFNVTVADGTSVTVYAYSIDNAGNSAGTGALQTTQTINFEYSISGKVFLDNNPPVGRNTGDPTYSGGIHIKVVNTSTGLTAAECLASACTAGTYSLTVPSGTYRVSYENFDGVAYELTEPPPGVPPPLFTVTVGSGCEEDVSPPPYSQNASCSSNNIVNLDFGIKAKIVSPPWFQCIGADCRIDDKDGSGGEPPSGPPSGFEDDLPDDVAGPKVSCDSDPTTDDFAHYASLSNNTSNMPGIIFSAGPLDFGNGEASQPNWQVGNSPFNPVRPNVIRTSYNYYTSVVTQNGISTRKLQDFCDPSNCTLPTDGTLLSGVYVYDVGIGDVHLNAHAFDNPSDKDYVFLVKGDLYIDGEIKVPTGSTVTFSVGNDIKVKSTVGGPATTPCDISTHTGCHVEGYYSADRHFTIEASNLRLNVAGAIVLDADKTDGTVGIISYTSRDLGIDNAKCPAFTLTERTDFILNAPDFLKHAAFTWQEVAP